MKPQPPRLDRTAWNARYARRLVAKTAVEVDLALKTASQADDDFAAGAAPEKAADLAAIGSHILAGLKTVLSVYGTAPRRLRRNPRSSTILSLYECSVHESRSK